MQKQGSGPAIQDEKSSSGKSYGEVFTYKKSLQGSGLAVTGFSGSKNTTIIFQNKSGNTPVIEIAEGSFKNSKTEEAILTEGIGYIGKGAFVDCDCLHQVVLPMSMKEIGDSAVENCSSLKSVSLPMMLERIGDNAFKRTGLKTLKIPKSVYWIGDGVLSGCSELEQIANIILVRNQSLLKAMFFESLYRSMMIIHLILVRMVNRTIQTIQTNRTKHYYPMMK